MTSYPAGTVTVYSWAQQAYRGMLYPVYFSGLVPMTAQLNFSSNTGGTFTGTFYATSPFNVSGPFSLTGP